MKAAYEDIRVKKGTHSFLAFHFSVPAFPFKWHYHPEYEITLIESGIGKRLVGDSYEHFQSGDLVMIGSELPHTWESDKIRKKKSAATVIQFSKEFMQPFLEQPEMAEVKKLLSASRRGLHFRKRVTSLDTEIKSLARQEGAERITGLLHILHVLSTLKSKRLASDYFHPAKSKENETRINRVCQHVIRNSTEKISMPEVAALVHLSPSAFCKFFKRTTGKTFSDYMNEIRIGHACHLLTESDQSIAVVAYSSGFESLTYFNRVFVRKKKMTPKEFRKLT